MSGYAQPWEGLRACRGDRGAVWLSRRLWGREMSVPRNSYGRPRTVCSPGHGCTNGRRANRLLSLPQHRCILSARPHWWCADGYRQNLERVTSPDPGLAAAFLFFLLCVEGGRHHPWFQAASQHCAPGNPLHAGLRPKGLVC